MASAAAPATSGVWGKGQGLSTVASPPIIGQMISRCMIIAENAGPALIESSIYGTIERIVRCTSHGRHFAAP